MRAVAAALGVAGPLGEQCRDRWAGDPSARERHALLALRASADLRVDTASGSGAGPAHLSTALGWLRRFVETFPSRQLFVPHEVAGDVRAAAYNEETFRLLSEVIRRHGSVRPGRSREVVSAATIADYISALRAFRSREAGYSLLVPGGNLRLPKQLQQMRKEDGPAGQRSLARGLSSRLLRRLCTSPACERLTGRGLLRWAVIWVGHNLLLRGGELGRPENKEFDPALGITIADVEWVAPCDETSGYEVVIIDVMPIKDARVTRARVPLLIRRKRIGRFVGILDLCSACPWEALRAWWERRMQEVSPIMVTSAPLFTLPGGHAVRTSDVLALVREAAAFAGESPVDFDAHSMRIGGATDIYHLFGAAAAERVIQKRGRWCSMVHEIYTRLSATQMLSVSADVTEVVGVDMEAFRHGYVMPAVRSRPRRT